ncbi:threonine/serine dehydratase [Microbaculum marinum]|uniref:Threonine/serine dehydratase n=1 Tax=Microbaculum marinum TaxID=1764581 RepID=A0AAW9RAD6_9HYPH
MVTSEDIETAYERIAGRVRRTPVMDIAAETFGTPSAICLKLELFQHAGSFKPRGAFNNLLSREVPEAGVAAASGGNHGAAVAYAARSLGIPARIFVPEISSPVKVGRIRGFGADVLVEGAAYADALERCEAFMADSGAVGVHAYDSPETIAGQGTVALEWQEQEPDLDTVLVAVGGAGLISGIAAWYGGRTRVVGVEPETSRALHAALEEGRPVDVPVSGLAADSLGARSVGDHNFEICRTYVDHVALVPDTAIGEAQRLLWDRARIAAEPGGATALAAVVCGAYRPRADERVGVLVCGGNVDLAKLSALA